MSDTPGSLVLTAVRAPALVQDAGRRRFMHEGVPPGGAMVPEWLAAANRAVGNPADCAAIELFGPIVVGARGGPLALAADDGAPCTLADGDTREFAPRPGVRAGYLAVHGGIDVPFARGGRGTLLVAQLGGFHGRPLRRGDELPIGALPNPPAQRGSTPTPVATLSLDDARTRVLRVVPGPDLARFAPDALATLLAADWRVSPTSDRVGTRLESAAAVLARSDDDQAVSTPMVRGAIQVPASGAPIVLGPDHPTTGGYPVIAAVVHADWGALGARVPGAPVRFALAARALSAGP